MLYRLLPVRTTLLVGAAVVLLQATETVDVIGAVTNWLTGLLPSIPL